MGVPGKFFHQNDFQITQKDPEELLRLVACGELGSVDITTAFLRRAVLAQKLVRKEELPKCLINLSEY